MAAALGENSSVLRAAVALRGDIGDEFEPSMFRVVLMIHAYIHTYYIHTHVYIYTYVYTYVLHTNASIHTYIRTYIRITYVLMQCSIERKKSRKLSGDGLCSGVVGIHGAPVSALQVREERGVSPESPSGLLGDTPLSSFLVFAVSEARSILNSSSALRAGLPDSSRGGVFGLHLGGGESEESESESARTLHVRRIAKSTGERFDIKRMGPHPFELCSGFF